MSLRARLVASLALTLAVALVLAGAALVGFVRQSLVDRVDQELVGLAGSTDRFRRLEALAGSGEAGRRVAVMRLDRQGRVQRSFPSGFASDPDPLPDLPRYADGIPEDAYGVIQTRASEDGSVAYRVLLGRGFGTGAIAVAAPLAGVDEAVQTLVRTLVVVGSVALVALMALAWVIVRRGLLPLERLERAARDVSAGDLAHRTGIPHDQTEVGRVGAAFDAMLDRIEAGFTSQQAALDAKAQSEERLRQFVADASHELRTPLTAVRGYADLYRAGGLREAGELDAAMERIGTESRRMGGLVDDLLLLARLDQGRPLRADPVDLTRLVAEAVADARAVEPTRPIGGSVEPGVFVRGDEDRLRQVVGNLLANVRVHTPPGSPAEVVLRRVATVATGAAGAASGTGAAGAGGATGFAIAELRVVDHGPGIQPAQGARVFDRFYRVDAARSRDRGGSGLGLSIVASITHALGGELWHEPTPVGGTTFVVRLPLATRSQETHSSISAPVQAPKA